MAGGLRASCVFVVVAMGTFCPALVAEPAPGDVFREYTWYKQDGDAGQALRVGGRVGYKGSIVLGHSFDLEHAVKAEVVIEKILCHDSTTGLAIQINDSDWICIPEAQGIPAPQSVYQHHFYPTVRIPLSVLKSGSGNEFQMKVDTEHPWRWPQNLINGVHFRIYYDRAKKAHPAGKIVTPESGGRLGAAAALRAEADSPNGKIKQVDFVGLYQDVNYEGDGIYRQWHYHFFHGRLMNHIGTVTAAPFEMMWDTSWVPDQKEPFEIAARVIDETGMIRMTEAVTDLSLVRPGLSVELCKPYDIPAKWVTRAGVKAERFDVTGDLDKAVAVQLAWSSWSPGYLYGISVNGKKVFEREGPKYAAYWHRVTLDDTSMFKRGVNVLTTAKTPKINGQTVHGCEVNWPGIMVLIQYRD